MYHVDIGQIFSLQIKANSQTKISDRIHLVATDVCLRPNFRPPFGRRSASIYTPRVHFVSFLIRENHFAVPLLFPPLLRRLGVAILVLLAVAAARSRSDLSLSRLSGRAKV